jgi:hypothetical protein
LPITASITTEPITWHHQELSEILAQITEHKEALATESGDPVHIAMLSILDRLGNMHTGVSGGPLPTQLDFDTVWNEFARSNALGFGSTEYNTQLSFFERAYSSVHDWVDDHFKRPPVKD